MAALEVDLATIKEGNTMTVKWRGKPVFVKHRTDVEIEREQAVQLSDLRDPETDAARVQDPKVFLSLLISLLVRSSNFGWSVMEPESASDFPVPHIHVCCTLLNALGEAWSMHA